MSSEPISPSSLPPLSASARLSASLQQRERLEARGDFLRAIGDFADADDDGDAVFGDGGGGVRHFLVFTFTQSLQTVIPRMRLRSVIEAHATQSSMRSQVWIASSLRSSQ